MNSVIKWAITGSVLALTACAGLPRTTTVDPVAEMRWQQRYEVLTAVDSWKLRGRLGVRTSTSADSVSMIWQRDDEQHQVELFGPLGGGRVRVSQDAEGAHMINAKGETDEAADATELLYRQTGWFLPLQQIVYWIAGIPAPGDEEHQIDDAGRLSHLVQDGWEVDFLDYVTHGDIEIPRKMVAVSHYEPEGGDVSTIKVKLVISQWELGRPSIPSS